MEFTENWTKENNDFYRSLIKEGKSIDEIEQIMGDKLKYHPKGRYTYNFSSFVLNEIKYNREKKGHYFINKESDLFENEYNYEYILKTDSDYIVSFIYCKDTIGPYIDTDLYNFSFTIEEQYEKDFEIYEKPTGKGEQLEIMRNLISIFEEFNKYIVNIKKSKVVYVIGETEYPRKINFYRDAMKNSFDIIETEGESSFNNGKNVYYYEFKK